MILNPIIFNIFEENDPRLCSSDIGGIYKQTLSSLQIQLRIRITVFSRPIRLLQPSGCSWPFARMQIILWFMDQVGLAAGSFQHDIPEP